MELEKQNRNLDESNHRIALHWSFCDSNTIRFEIQSNQIRWPEICLEFSFFFFVPVSMRIEIASNGEKNAPNKEIKSCYGYSI